MICRAFRWGGVTENNGKPTSDGTVGKGLSECPGGGRMCRSEELAVQQEGMARRPPWREHSGKWEVWWEVRSEGSRETRSPGVR